MFDGLFCISEFHRVKMSKPKEHFEHRFDLVNKDVSFRNKPRFASTKAFHVIGDRGVVFFIIETFEDNEETDELVDLIGEDRIRLVATKTDSDWTLSLSQVRVLSLV